MAIVIQTGTIVVAIATLTGAAIGALIQRWRESRAQRRNLRNALKVEMHMLTEIEPDLIPEPAVVDIIPTTVYNSNVVSIGALSEEEVTKIVRINSAVFWFQSELQIFEAAGNDNGELAKRTLETLFEYRLTAEQSLKVILDASQMRVNP